MGAKSYISVCIRVQMQVLLLLFARLLPLSLPLAPVESVRQPRAPATGEQCCARETPPQVLSDVDGAGLKNKLSQSGFANRVLCCLTAITNPGPIATCLFRAQAGAGVGERLCLWSWLCFWRLGSSL
jgi:hypothetical protein